MYDNDHEYCSYCDHCQSIRLFQEKQLGEVSKIMDDLLEEYSEFRMSSVCAENSYIEPKYYGRLEISRVDFTKVPKKIPPDYYQGAKVIIRERIKQNDWSTWTIDYHKPSEYLKRLDGS